MSILKLVLDSESEIYQVETEVEISIPAKIDEDIFEDSIGIHIQCYGEEPYHLTLSPKGMEAIVKFWNENKHNVSQR